ncbi:MAG: peptidoglycan DD-metalloendopeptidase family protein [Bacteroidetes bacterium]|uniref:fibronectin type III domain-containing protein n=1 Tax=Phnomibacter sp. TaxID=2836217 RepID=UPI002FDC8BD6|nr:peptidoglycan DD-metalloendopeptidase family protein [Bacteroidota bacterium]
MKEIGTLFLITSFAGKTLSQAILKKKFQKNFLKKGFRRIAFVYVFLSTQFSYAQNPSDVPLTLMSPIIGTVTYQYPPTSCPWMGTTIWGFCQHQTGGHTSNGGISQANDTYAWDCNLSSNFDAGKDVYPVDDGYIANLSGWSGGSYGQLLIRHVTNGKTWYSGYLHMSNITAKKSTPGAFVSKNEIIGKVDKVSPDAISEHLHFAVYYLNADQKLISVDRSSFTVRSSCNAIVPQLSTPAVNQTNTGIPVYFDWNDVTGTNPEYRIQVSTSNSGWTAKDGFTSATTENSTIRVNRNTGSISNLSWELTDLFPPAGLTTYYYTVKAFVCGQSSDYSPVRSFTTTCVPTIPVLIAPNAGAAGVSIPVNFDWNDLPSTVTGLAYRIQVSTSNAGWTPANGFASTVMESSTVRVNKATGTTSSYLWPTNATYPPQPGTTYYWTVKAFGCNINTNYSQVRSFTTASNAALPGSFTLTATPECSGTSSQVRLSWTASANATSYDIYRNGTLLASNITTTQYINTGLTAGTQYTYYVQAKNTAVNTNNSNGTLAVTALNCAPAVPGTFTLTATPECSGTSSQVPLSWTASANATSYDIYRNGTLLAPNITTTQYINTGLTAGTQYTYYVQAKNTAGNTNNSNGILAVTALNCAPTLPGLFTLSVAPECNVTLSQIKVSWTPSANATSYDVYRNGQLYLADIVSTQLNNTGLTVGATYSYLIKAKNQFGTIDNQNGTLSTIAPYCAGVYTFVGSGNFNNPSNWSPSILPPNPLPAGNIILINGTGECILNVPQTISAGATLRVVSGKLFRVNGNLIRQ